MRVQPKREMDALVDGFRYVLNNPQAFPDEVSEYTAAAAAAAADATVKFPPKRQYKIVKHFDLSK